MAFQPAPLFNTDGVTAPQAIAIQYALSSIIVVQTPAQLSVQAAPTIGYPQRATGSPIG